MAGLSIVVDKSLENNEHLANTLLKREWTLEDLNLLHHISEGVYCVRLSLNQQGVASYEVLFANLAVQSRFGAPRTKEQVEALLKEETPAVREHLVAMTAACLKMPVGRRIHNVADNSKFYSLLFTEAKHEKVLAAVSQNIWLRMSPGQPAEKVTLVQMHPKDDNTVVSRIAKLFHRQPVLSFLFDSAGRFVMANRKAVAKSQAYLRPGCLLSTLTLLNIFEQSICKGGEAEIKQLYEEAMTAIFVEQRDCHRTTVEMKSHKRPGQRRFIMLEMWRMQDPVTAQDMVMVSMFNVTQQKELEMELQAHKELLWRENQILELEKIRLVREKAEIEEEKEEIMDDLKLLSEQLEAVINDKIYPQSQINANTPVDMMLTLLKNLLMGAVPSPATTLELYNTITNAADLHAPVQLEKQLLQADELDAEVGLAMLQLLKGGSQASLPGGLRRSSAAGSLLADEVRERRATMEEQRASAGSSCSTPDQPLSPSGRPRETFFSNGGGGGGGGCGHLATHSCCDSTDGSGSQSPTYRARAGKRRSSQSQQLAYPTEHERCLVQSIMSITPEVERLLQNAGQSWTFNIFSLSDSGISTPLSLLSFFLIKQSGLVSEFHMHELKLARFLRRIEEGYLSSNPYHNRVHAASVVHLMHMMLHHCGLRTTRVADSLSTLACYLAAAMHDFEHPGVNNDFLIKSHDPLAILYNDQSPLENHHLAAGFNLMMQPEHNFLEKMASEDKLRLRSMIIESVLATDMKRHFNILSRFQEVFRPLRHANLASEPSPCAWAALRAEDCSLARQVALKCADIGHLAGPWGVHQRWASLLEEEFFLQGDRERENGLPVSPLMDRQSKSRAGITKSQVGFFNIVGVPLFQSFAEVFKEGKPVCDLVVDNYNVWVQLQAGTAAPVLA